MREFLSENFDLKISYVAFSNYSVRGGNFNSTLILPQKTHRLLSLPLLVSLRSKTSLGKMRSKTSLPISFCIFSIIFAINLRTRQVMQVCNL